MPKSKKSSSKTASKAERKAKKFSMPNLKKVNIPERFKPYLKILGMVVVIIGSFALIDLAVQYINNDYSVAVVNGKRISVKKWHDELEKTYGSTVASLLIEEQIIKAEAKEADLSVTKEEINEELDKIVESIGGQEAYEAALEANNITEGELKDQIESDLLSQKILKPTLEYTDEEVQEFFDQYSDVIFPEETATLEEGELLDYDKYKEETEEIFVQQQVQMELDTWLTEKKSEYRIQDNSTAKPKYGFLTITTNIVNNLIDNVGQDTTEESAE